jgi:hypothetical protein
LITDVIRHRLKVLQTIRGVNGESKDVPFGTLIVVMFAAIPPGVPLKAICASYLHIPGLGLTK